MKIIGLDVGYGFTKVTDGDGGYSFPSVLGDGHKNFIFSTKTEKGLLPNNLLVNIDNQDFFLGRSAIRHSKYAFRDLSLLRNNSKDFEVLFYGALSFFADGGINKFKIVTGLPVERMHLTDYFKNTIKEKKYLTVYKDGKPTEVEIQISQLEIVPQPLGTYWNYYYNETNKEPSLDETVGVIDIGFKTTDIATIEHGEYIHQKSKTFSLGLSAAYEDISKNILIEFGLEKESHSLDDVIIKKELKVDGQAKDISKMLNCAFQKLANNILIEINSYWKTTEYDRLLITGGGGEALHPFILPEFPQAKLVTDSSIANCKGFYAWANHLWDGNKG
jgi:plasmid segregation protein ParM